MTTQTVIATTLRLVPLVKNLGTVVKLLLQPLKMSAENAKVKVVVRLRPPADPSIDAAETVRIFPEQPGLIKIR